MTTPSPARALAAGLLLALAPLACGGGDATPDAATGVTLADLPAPATEFAEAFSGVSGVHELPDGRLVVVDATEATVQVLDLAAGTATALGQRGGGPGEYQAPAGLLRLPGDSFAVLDVGGGNGAGAMRVVRFGPDLGAGTTSTMMLFDQTDTSVVQGTMFAGADGQLYSTSIKLVIGPQGPLPGDTMHIVRFPLTATPTFTKLGAIRTPQTGQREQQINGQSITIKQPFPGLVTADAWAAFPDGRLAIVRGEGYTVEFVAPDGTRGTPVAVPYERIPVTPEDQTAELDAAREQLATVLTVVRRTLPPGFQLDIEILPPPSWPAEYPPVAPIVAHAAPDGRLWVRRSVPVRLDQERWDVIGPDGALVAQWRLPAMTSLVAVGDGAVYLTRKDDDDLRHLQRVVLPR
jgi:hypothetical protein